MQSNLGAFVSDLYFFMLHSTATVLHKRLAKKKKSINHNKTGYSAVLHFLIIGKLTDRLCFSFLRKPLLCCGLHIFICGQTRQLWDCEVSEGWTKRYAGDVVTVLGEVSGCYFSHHIYPNYLYIRWKCRVEKTNCSCKKQSARLLKMNDSPLQMKSSAPKRKKKTLLESSIESKILHNNSQREFIVHKSVQLVAEDIFLYLFFYVKTNNIHLTWSPFALA